LIANLVFSNPFRYLQKEYEDTKGR